MKYELLVGWGPGGGYSLYLGEKIILEKGGGAKISYFGQIYTPVKRVNLEKYIIFFQGIYIG